ncbi:hypothetical protein MCUN1_002737 [Malassezia cuniculi]|uniref:DUF221-domain-containing protein n=1 Tax=Malassezia cuniculi TaxID=948313 RepID=A0AAF0EWK5_9BASI|nr:hypothetical protein MCUN1_002737 [Malassezia cuniculi]
MFLRMLRWLFTVLAVFCCIVLIPIDVAYIANNKAKSETTDEATNNQNTQNFLSTSLAGVYGKFLWAHVVIEYIVTILILAFLWVYYRHAIRLRQQFFTSHLYQSSFSSRTLLVTNIKRTLQSDMSLRTALENTKIPYPLIEVQVGNDFGNLPAMLERQHELVHKLEVVLNRYLSRQDPNYPRPKIVIEKKLLGMGGGETVDAIDYYGAELSALEEQIDIARKDLDNQATTAYGFASVSAPQYAHTAARLLHHKHVEGLSVRLAPFPHDLIWKNLAFSRGQRQRLQFYGFLLCVLLFVVNIFPLVATSFLSNLELFSTLIGFLKSWHRASTNTFAAVSGLLPPVISVCFALILPRIMHRIVIYQGVRTKEICDLALCGQYFLFLFLTQFVVFTMFGVGLAAALTVWNSVKAHDSAGSVVDNLSYSILERVASQLPVQSIYWMSWSTVRTYMVFFELAQVVRVVLVWVQKHTSRLTPRRILELSKPPSLDYWAVYAEMLFAAAIGVIYSTLAPLVVVFIAVMFWIASFVYKYQVLYVYSTKSETGGRLWQVAMNRILVGLVCMQIIMALVVGLKVSDAQQKWDMWSWIKAIACLPPCVAVLAFKLYCRAYLDKAFRWYDPSPLDLAQSSITPPDTQSHLERQFGHPFLHEPLWVPIVAAEYMPLVRSVYGGPVRSSRHKDRVLEQQHTPDSTSILDDDSKEPSLSSISAGGMGGYLPTHTGDIELEPVRAQPPLRQNTFEPEVTPLVQQFDETPQYREPTVIETTNNDYLTLTDEYRVYSDSRSESLKESDVVSYYAAIDEQK